MAFISRILTQGCSCIPLTCKRWLPTSESDEDGGFEQMVHIYSCVPGSKSFKRGTVVIDPCNKGPSLVTTGTMLRVNGQLIGPGTAIKAYDGEERTTDGEVELCFSAPGRGMGSKKRYYTETFHCVPHIADGIDMILNSKFYNKYYKDKVPGVLMIRSGQKKKTKEQKQQREDRERKQEEEAQKQAATRRDEIQAAEERIKAQQAGYYNDTTNSSPNYNASSSSYDSGSNGH